MPWDPVESGYLDSLLDKSMGLQVLIGVFDFAIYCMKISIDSLSNSGNRPWIRIWVGRKQ